MSRRQPSKKKNHPKRDFFAGGVLDRGQALNKGA